MQKTEKLDMARLLGFDTVATELAGRIGFQDETLSAKLGAKVGEQSGPALFQNEDVAAKLGAKVGTEPGS